jgi:hypothetical protein
VNLKNYNGRKTVSVLLFTAQEKPAQEEQKHHLLYSVINLAGSLLERNQDQTEHHDLIGYYSDSSEICHCKY